MLIVPLSADARQQFVTELDGQSVQIAVNWSPLSQSWFLSIQFRDGQRVASGRQMASRVRLIRSPLFSGDLVVVALDPLNYSEPGRQAWAGSHHADLHDRIGGGDAGLGGLKSVRSLGANPFVPALLFP